MKEVIYYFRDYLKRPLITVCLLKDEDGNVARGVSICSPRDNPSKAEGRMLAVGRAYKAMWSRCSKSPMTRQEVIHIALNVVNWLKDFSPSKEGNLGYKINYNPTLSEFEEKLLAEKP